MQPRSACATSSSISTGLVRGLDLYSSVHAYTDIASIDASLPTVIVDMSGNGKVMSMLHAHLGANMLHCAAAWLKFDRVTGMAGMQAAYDRVLNGESAPDRGVIVAL